MHLGSSKSGEQPRQSWRLRNPVQQLLPRATQFSLIRIILHSIMISTGSLTLPSMPAGHWMQYRLADAEGNQRSSCERRDLHARAQSQLLSHTDAEIPSKQCLTTLLYLWNVAALTFCQLLFVSSGCQTRCHGQLCTSTTTCCHTFQAHLASAFAALANLIAGASCIKLNACSIPVACHVPDGCLDRCAA